jgi:hypothetical protein
MSKEAMKLALEALMHEMKYVLCCINLDIVPFDGDDFHEALRLGKEALAKQEQGEPVAWQVEVYVNGTWSPMGNPQRDKSRAEALAGNPSIPKDQVRVVSLYTTPPKQEQGEPVAYIHRNEYNEYRLEPHDNFDIKSIPFNVDVPLFKEKNT